MEPIRWGVLGAGGIAATVGADIAAHRRQRRCRRSAPATPVARRHSPRRHGVPRSYGSYAELVADPDVDVVYIATTHAQHHEHALLALRAGKPVLVEKAFTLNARAGRRKSSAEARGAAAVLHGSDVDAAATR